MPGADAVSNASASASVSSSERGLASTGLGLVVAGWRPVRSASAREWSGAGASRPRSQSGRRARPRHLINTSIERASAVGPGPDAPTR
ncbi:hypothetical protein CcI49_18695 [Frankia sp. CcI49]|nr:hypothetical protein CcI49_18695 [Frankia sp. CcI49]